MKKKTANENVIETYHESRAVAIGAVILTALVPVLAVLLCDMFKISDNEIPIRALMKIVLFGITIYGFYTLIKKKMTFDKAIWLVILSGIVIRLGYMLYTSWTKRYYDVGNLGSDGVGHAAYIVQNILKGHLPETNSYQFYHPPLYYMLSGAVIKVVSLLRRTKDYASLIKYAAAVSCSASCLTVFAVQRLADELKLKIEHQLPAIAVIAFFPNMILMGGRVNNDALVTLFMVLSIYFTVKWYHETKTKWIIAIALSIGLGMMTKISCGVVALFTGSIMLYKLYEAYKDKRLLPIIKQLAIFALICFPLALWYPIRNYIRFGQSFNYVLDLGTNSHVYTGNIPWYKRFFSVPLWEEFKQPFMNSSNDYSIFMIVTRTAVFGEFAYENVSKIISVSLYFVNLFLIILSLVAMVLVLIKDKTKEWFIKYSMAALWLIVFVSFISVNVSYPHSCTADTRYIPLAVISCCMYISKMYEMRQTVNAKYLRGYANITSVCIIAFAALVVIMYA